MPQTPKKALTPKPAFLIVSLAAAFFATGSLLAAEPPTGPIKLNPPADSNETEEVHVVQKGDTLWDLTAHYLNNPWYWPKVWSYNPQISNPHFLYPGDKIRFTKGGDQQPGQILASSTRDMPEQAASQEGAEAGAPKFVEASVGYDPNHRGMIVQNIQMLTEKELAEAGTLQNAMDGKTMLSTYDIAFIRFKKGVAHPAVGSKVVFYQKVGSVDGVRRHGPDYVLTMITGTGVITDNSANQALVTVRIEKTFEPIERGQFVAPLTQPLTVELKTTPNAAKVSGTLLAGEYWSKDLIGQFHYVFVDRGNIDGVKNGNTFVVIRDHDDYSDHPGDPIPPQVVGSLVIVDAKDSASMALVTQSLLDLKPGDHVEMRMP